MIPRLVIEIPVEGEPVIRVVAASQDERTRLLDWLAAPELRDWIEQLAEIVRIRNVALYPNGRDSTGPTR